MAVSSPRALSWELTPPTPLTSKNRPVHERFRERSRSQVSGKNFAHFVDACAHEWTDLLLRHIYVITTVTNDKWAMSSSQTTPSPEVKSWRGTYEKWRGTTKLVLPHLDPSPLQQGGLGEHCKLPQWGLGRSPSRQRFWCIFEWKGSILGNIILRLLTAGIISETAKFTTWKWPFNFRKKTEWLVSDRQFKPEIRQRPIS